MKRIYPYHFDQILRRIPASSPPNLVAFTWHVGRERSDKQEVTVSFSSTEGGTRVELVHTGWDGELELRERYDSGWTGVHWSSPAPE